MINLLENLQQSIDVIVIGGGPAGLSVATRLKKEGIGRVIILERKNEAGGMPRHCGHSPFGIREFKQILRGPQYAKKLIETAKNIGVEIFCNVTVLKPLVGAKLKISTQFGQATISAKKIVFATGGREKTRSARLIPGARAAGIINTGALQSMIYLNKIKPFKNPVIIGTELVSFSSIMTCFDGSIKPVAMIEKNSETLARWPSKYFAMANKIPIYFNSKITDISAKNNIVNSVEILNENGKTELINCDGVIVSGDFTPESMFEGYRHLEIDNKTKGLKIDQFFRCSDTDYYAVGNMLRAIETAGWCWSEGQYAGKIIARDLSSNKIKENLNSNKNITTIPITLNSSEIKYIMPQLISKSLEKPSIKYLQLRVKRKVNGTIKLMANNSIVWQKKGIFRQERRILIPVSKLKSLEKIQNITISFVKA